MTASRDISARLREGVAVTSLDKLRLWFFREMNDDQRLALFSLFGFPVEEAKTHGVQMLLFKRVFEAVDALDAREALLKAALAERDENEQERVAEWNRRREAEGSRDAAKAAAAALKNERDEWEAAFDRSDKTASSLGMKLHEAEARLTALEEQNRALWEALETVPPSFIAAFMERRAWTAARTIDVISRKDAIERQLEGDWLKQFVPALDRALGSQDGEAK